jgi:ArsR family transcriptional regulator
MANLELIAPHKVATFRFSTAPVHNLLCSLFLLNDEKDEFSEWVNAMVEGLSTDQLRENKMLTGIASRFIEGKEWSSFPEWLEAMEARDPQVMHEWLIKDFLKASSEIMGLPPDQLPSPEEILADDEFYLSTYEKVYEKKGHTFDREYHKKEYQLLKDPTTAKEKIISYMRRMWEDNLEDEWERVQPMLHDSIKAFESLDFSDMSTEEALLRITGRDHLPQIWDHWIATTEEVVIVPSAHIGPYLMTMDKNDTTVWLVVRAHIPEGAAISSPSLTRSELLMRLSALSNDTRLRILELLNTKGELNATDIQNELDLTQSATSRHLMQLFATGFLHQRRLEGVKHYSINYDRITNTADALVGFLEG